MAPNAAPPATCRNELPPTGSDAHRVARLASGIRSAARDAGVVLSRDYADLIACEGLGRCGQLGVTKLGGGVVIHTVPDSGGELPVVLGYADGDGEWFRSGARHHVPEVAG